MQTEEEKLKYRLHTALEKLIKEDKDVIEQFNKSDSGINTLLAVNLGIFSLEVTVLINIINSLFENNMQKEQIILIICTGFLIIAIIIININSIMNIRKSSKISENRYSNNKKLDDFIDNLINENNLIKREIIRYQKNIDDNKTKLKSKKKYINEALNNIILSIFLISIMLIILFLKYVVIT